MPARPLAAIFVIVAVGLSACGDDEGEDTTVVSTTTVTDTRDTTTPTDTGGPGPRGPLTLDSVGVVAQGASTDEVIAEFGEPDSQEEVPGCELDPEAPPVLQYAYEMTDGRLVVSFDAQADKMTSYFTDSAELETERGDRVGGSWRALADHWGPALDPVLLGTAKAVPGEGVYKVGYDEAQLMFDLRDQRIERISGGYLPPCE